MVTDFMDEIDCGSFFDQIDDLIEFPADNESADSKDFPTLWPNSLDALPPASDHIFSGNHSNTASDLSAELSVPYEDIVQLEWLSNFVEDSFSGGGMTIDKNNISGNKEPSENQFQTSSPVSVLESSSSSSSSCSGAGEGKMAALSPTRRGPQRARSKRSRPATFNPRPAILLLSPTSSVSDNPPPFPVPVASSESENFAESRPLTKKKKKVKLSAPFGSVAVETNQNQNQSVRKCMHCEITKTPQWRAGPMGPKTLCNACGVRYKSGRLFPEYRPAASPTFVPSIHSNSHKKVLEMRNKGGPGDNKASIFMAEKSATPTTDPPAPELIPNNIPSLDFI
ncbi:GATA transcription factor 8 isoform X2 [Diospyros lotus]|uniref:GATA transcription factor 8 isoform X2 n=1 Tax=Diospyros lotus TaxID=55363 RepID=UPI0022505B5C|nr:GATA transcription factor 8 isoform X2 [Diospyros lotus]